jgi:PAS domain S-box-containing protein
MSNTQADTFKLILDNMSEGFFILNPEGVIVRCNKSALEILGMSSENFLGKKIADTCPNCVREDGSPFKVSEFPSSKVFETKKNQTNVVLGSKGSDGKTRWVQINSFLLENSLPELPLATLSTFSDVSVQIEKKLALAKRELQLLETQAVAQIGCWSFNVHTFKFHWTPEMYKIFDFPIENGEPTPLELKKKIHQDDLENFMATFKKSMRGEEIIKARFRVVHADKIIWMESHCKAVQNNGKAFREVRGTCRDITEKMNLELQNSFILEALNIGVWEWHLPKNELIWDHRMYEVYGANQNHISSDSSAFKQSVHPDDFDGAIRDVEVALTGTKKFESNFRALPPNGIIKYIGAKGVVIDNEAGHPEVVYGICWDRSHEVRMAQSRDEERAKAIQVSKLSSLGEMAGGVAHEINNPLTIIRSSVAVIRRELQKKNLTPAKLLDSLEDIDVTVKRISQIVTGLRNLSRDSSSEEVSRFKLKSVFDDVLAICSEKFKTNDVKILIEDKENIFEREIECRRVQLSQVLLNLLMNAQDAVFQEKEKWVSIRIVKTSSRYQIHIVDAGHGIPKMIQDKIFNPFFTTKDIGRGTGLGLSLSRTIVENNKGRLYLNEKSPNTCFIVDYPLSKMVP